MICRHLIFLDKPLSLFIQADREMLLFSEACNAWCFCRILDLLGADVRVFDPTGLPIKDDASEAHPKVVELRELSMWSEAHVSPFLWPSLQFQCKL